jgi:hypothetical protein
MPYQRPFGLCPGLNIPDMKMNTNKFQEKAKQLRASASKFTKQQIAAMTAVTMGLAAVTIATFSQEAPQPTVAVEATSMALPARMTITDINGRQIDVTVLERDPTGITIQRMDASGNPEARQFHVAWEKLDPSVREKLEGVKPATIVKKEVTVSELLDIENPTRLERGIINKEVYRRGSDLWKKYEKVSAKELQKLLIEKDYDMMLLTHSWRTQKPFTIKGVTYTYAADAATSINIPELADEKVSLRPEFEKLGVNAIQQEHNLCSVYSSYKLVEFLTKKAGVKPPSLSEWKKMGTNPLRSNPDAIVELDSMPALANYVAKFGRTLHVTKTDILPKQLAHEVTKDLLRKGVPTVLSWVPRKKDGYSGSGISHASVVVGFVVKDGITQWEILDSNFITDENKGYKFIDASLKTTESQSGIEIK